MKRRSFFSAIGLSALVASTASLTRAASPQESKKGKIDQRITALGLTLPVAPDPVAAYKTFRISGNQVFIAGQGPIHSPDHPGFGRVGHDLTTEQGYHAARTTGLNILAQLKKACNGDLDRVVQCLQIQGLVQCTEDYKDTPKVINGASELFRDVFGDSGLAARAAIGTTALPSGIACEILSIWEIR